MRGRMSDAPSYAAPVEIGEVIGGTVSQVVASKTQNSKKASGFFRKWLAGLRNF